MSIVFLFLSFISQIAFAQAAGGAKPGILESLAPMAVIIVVMYFLIIRPQQKRGKQQQEFINTLKKGDVVITSSGIFGEITGVTEQIITLAISDNVRIKILRSQIARLAKEEGK